MVSVYSQSEKLDLKLGYSAVLNIRQVYFLQSDHCFYSPLINYKNNRWS